MLISSLYHKLYTFVNSLKRPSQTQSQNTQYRLLHGMSWGVIGGAASKTLLLLSNVVIARYLGKTAYGEYGIIQNTIGMLGIFAGLGIGLTATKYVAQFKYTDTVKTGKILGLSAILAISSGLCMSLILLVMAPYLARTTLAAPHLTHSLKVGSLLLFLNAVTGAQTGALYGFEAFKKISIVNIVIAVLCIPITLIGVWQWNLSGAIWAGVLILSLNWIINYYLIQIECRRHGLSIKIMGCWSELPILWKYSLPATMSGIMVAPITWVVSAILVNQPNGYAEMGVFSAANQWRTVLIFIPTIIGQIITPIMSERLGVGGRLTTLKMLKTSMLVSALAVIPVALIVSMISPWIMQLYGKTFSNGWPVLLVVLATVSILAIQTPIANLINASGKMWIATFMNAGWGIVVIISARLLSAYGALGLALAYLIGYMVHSIWTFWFAWRKLNET